MSVASLQVEPAPILASRARPVEVFDDALRQLLAEMHAVMLLLRGVGLAGPQVGVPWRVFTFEADSVRGAAVNPVILSRIGPYHPDEGCLSVPGRFFRPLRHHQIEAAWQDADGSPCSAVLTGLLAEIFEHEVDHLDGVLLHQLPQLPGAESRG